MSQTNTALLVSFTACQNDTCDTFYLTDKTGIYNAVNTVGGWGAPNPSIAECLTATLDVTAPDGTICAQIDLIALSTSTFPNISDIPVTITSALLSLGTKFTDGVYELTVTYSGDEQDGDDSPWESSTTIFVLFDCQVNCCLKKLFASITGDDCAGCSTSIVDRVTKAYMYLKAGHAAACCGGRNRAEKLLTNAQFLCSLTNCSSC